MTEPSKVVPNVISAIPAAVPANAAVPKVAPPKPNPTTAPAAINTTKAAVTAALNALAMYSPCSYNIYVTFYNDAIVIYT